jgi:hypothetical protein
MLHFETLPDGSLGFLKDLTKHPAHRFGHRRSIDFDFFTPEPFDVESLADTLSREVEGFESTGMNKIGLNASIDGLKVDFMTYR